MALGAEPFKPSIEGIECGNILDVLEAHQGEKMGDKIIVCGGLSDVILLRASYGR